MSKSTRWAYRSTSRLVLILTVMLSAGALVDLASAASSQVELSMLQAAGSLDELDPDEAEANDARERLIGWAALALHLATIAVFSVFLYRTNANARALGAENMRFTPGSAVGYCFVPILNLYRPFQAVREMWQASSPREGRWRRNPTSSLLGFWWAAWIASMGLGQITFRLARSATTYDQFLALSWLSLIHGMVSSVMCVLTIGVVRGLARLQARSLEELGGLEGLERQESDRPMGVPLHPGDRVDGAEAADPFSNLGDERRGSPQ